MVWFWQTRQRSSFGERLQALLDLRVGMRDFLRLAERERGEGEGGDREDEPHASRRFG